MRVAIGIDLQTRKEPFGIERGHAAHSRSGDRLAVTAAALALAESRGFGTVQFIRRAPCA